MINNEKPAVTIAFSHDEARVVMLALRAVAAVQYMTGVGATNHKRAGLLRHIADRIDFAQKRAAA